jgi:hypothetical protein
MRGRLSDGRSRDHGRGQYSDARLLPGPRRMTLRAHLARAISPGVVVLSLLWVAVLTYGLLPSRIPLLGVADMGVWT